ncbi:MAG: hypothetical protein ACK5RL_02300 [Acidimicrobiales bacterium]
MTTPILAVALVLSVGVWLLGFAAINAGGTLGRGAINLAVRIRPTATAEAAAADRIATVDRLAADGHRLAAVWAGAAGAWSLVWAADEPDDRSRVTRPRGGVGILAAAVVAAVLLGAVIALWKIGRWVAAGLAWPLLVPAAMAAGLAWMVRNDHRRATADRTETGSAGAGPDDAAVSSDPAATSGPAAAPDPAALAADTVGPPEPAATSAPAAARDEAATGSSPAAEAADVAGSPDIAAPSGAAENDVDAVTGGDDRDVEDGGAGAAAPVLGVASEPADDVGAAGRPDGPSGHESAPDAEAAATVIDVRSKRGGEMDTELTVRFRLPSGSAEFLRRGPIDLMLLNWTGRAADIVVGPLNPDAPAGSSGRGPGDDPASGHRQQAHGDGHGLIPSTIGPGERRAMATTEIGAVQITNLGPEPLALTVTLVRADTPGATALAS